MTVKKILISQNPPRVLNGYQALMDKFGVEIDFRPFFKIVPLSLKEFRTEKLNIPDYTAIVFSSRHAIDAFFAICEELHYRVPETLKYFCNSELVANYLQKHIVYRKRKIFFGDGTPESIIPLIGPKHREEHFLLTSSDTSNITALSRLFDEKGLKWENAVLVKTVISDLKDLDIDSYDLVVFYNAADVKSLGENFPAFKQGKTLFMSYGKGVVKSMEEAGLRIDIKAPTPEAPSAASAIDQYLQSKA